ncbi:hypothetical protein OO013_06455 [Mangrovivirga sp. M17]|uniref:Outer membrane beta-barrel protein n=1 Tax=Mangrovivirga halotolerans TaxID=2993936 RepID=A0ABT3RNX2_9BACT|nr:hypothetical protein [Mangrovivirga halotolerans]MCX2743498.1 hypothetical protein [Mangrovivirga halotolerans]
MRQLYILLLFIFLPGLIFCQYKDTTYINLGGAVRFNTMFTIYEGETFSLPTENRNGIFWDVVRFEVHGKAKGVGFDFEYRVYPGFNCHFLKMGYLTYEFSENSNIELGITQKPFGMLPYLGNSWWFQLPYYVGLEDDYDTGIKYSHISGNGNFRWKAAYYIMAEPRGQSDPLFGNYMSARYSYDVIPEDGYNGNKERNQLNLWLENDFTNSITAGLSFEVGQIYNSNIDESTPHYAFAAHSSIDLNERMNIKLQGTYYNYPDIKNDEGTETVDYINLGAYGFGTYQAASKATILSIGLSYNLPVEWGPIQSLTFYEDYSYMYKYGEIEIDGRTFSFVDSHHNVLGFLVTAGYIYTYFDIASGINQPWLSSAFGGSALSTGRGETPNIFPGDLDENSQVNQLDEDPSINTRFNINIGFYF